MKKLTSFLLLIVTNITHPVSPDLNTFLAATGTAVITFFGSKLLQEQFPKTFNKPNDFKSSLIKDTGDCSLISGMTLFPLLSTLVLYKNWNTLNPKQKLFLFAMTIPGMYALQNTAPNIKKAYQSQDTTSLKSTISFKIRTIKSNIFYYTGQITRKILLLFDR